MKRIMYFALCVALGVSCDAHALGAIADITIIDRDSGVALSAHYYRGDYWVAGRPGARYAIEIRNRLGERLLAVASVDGVNVVSGETAGWGQAGYVLSPGERYQITGWRKTDLQVAAFTFTDSPNSYAERTGRPANVGVIGVAVFRERTPPSIYAPPTIGQSPLRRQPPRAEEKAPSTPSELADKAPAARDSNAAGLAEASPSPVPGIPEAASKLGTGHGEREYSYVNHTEFLRMQPQPNEIIRIRYDSLDNLLAMGVIKRPRPGLPLVNPFPGSSEQQYVPDPPG